jgi:hypothetical protein
MTHSVKLSWRANQNSNNINRLLQKSKKKQRLKTTLSPQLKHENKGTRSILQTHEIHTHFGWKPKQWRTHKFPLKEDPKFRPKQNPPSSQLKRPIQFTENQENTSEIKDKEEKSYPQFLHFGLSLSALCSPVLTLHFWLYTLSRVRVWVKKKGEEKENERERERMAVQEGNGREKKEKGKERGSVGHMSHCGWLRENVIFF